jgi:methyl coenzyme M reductase beta subunit
MRTAPDFLLFEVDHDVVDNADEIVDGVRELVRIRPVIGALDDHTEVLVYVLERRPHFRC